MPNKCHLLRTAGLVWPLHHGKPETTGRPRPIDPAFLAADKPRMRVCLLPIWKLAHEQRRHPREGGRMGAIHV